MNVLLRRADHDRLLNTPLLQHLFASYGRSWGLAGVTFHDVRYPDREALAKALNEALAA